MEIKADKNKHLHNLSTDKKLGFVFPLEINGISIQRHQHSIGTRATGYFQACRWSYSVFIYSKPQISNRNNSWHLSTLEMFKRYFWHPSGTLPTGGSTRQLISALKHSKILVQLLNQLSASKVACDLEASDTISTIMQMMALESPHGNMGHKQI